MQPHPKCPYCGGIKTVKAGKRYNMSGSKQLYKCTICKRRFTPNDGFWKMKNKPEIIAEAISCYERGMSLRKVENHIWDWRGVSVSHTAIWTWIRKYSKMLTEWDAKQKPEIKGPIHQDEIVIKTMGEKNWRWGAKDKKTRFKFIGPLTKRRTYKDGAKPLLKAIKQRTYHVFKKRKEQGKPIRLVSDKLEHYRKGFNKYFFRVGQLYHGVPIACKKYGLKYNNNVIERDNQRIRQRIKVMRGFGNTESGEDILNLLDICHNYIDVIKLKGEKRARTPAERAKIKVNLGKSQRLLNLINFFPHDIIRGKSLYYGCDNEKMDVILKEPYSLIKYSSSLSLSKILLWNERNMINKSL